MTKKPGKRERTPSFVCELPLRVTQQQEVVLLTRLEAGRQLYNSCIGETMRRLRLIKQSKDYQKARSLKIKDQASLQWRRKIRTQLASQRQILFKRARERWGFPDYGVQAYATRICHSWIGDHIDAHTAQKLATRAYLAAEKVMYGRAKHMRFKGKNQLDSLESKSNVAGIRWRNDGVENNPNNYQPNGTISKGKKQWNNSKTYFKTRDAKANLERKLAGHRKSLHGEMANSILNQGDTFKLDKLSYKAFQKLFGKSVGKRAPGMFVVHLKRKAENAGGKVVEFPTYSTKLSQTCQCGRVKKKSLFERVHQCECGVHAQRDLYSAFLARCIDPDSNILQVSQVLSAWCSVESRLWAAWRTATTNQPAIRGLLPSSFGRCPEIELVAAEDRTEIPKSQNVVDASRESGKGIPHASVGQLEPPGFNLGEAQSYYI